MLSPGLQFSFCPKYYLTLKSHVEHVLSHQGIFLREAKEVAPMCEQFVLLLVQTTGQSPKDFPSLMTLVL